LHRYFERLKNEGNATAYNQIDFMIGKVKSRIKFSTEDSIANEGLHHFLHQTKTDLFEIGNAFSKQYFAYS
jgi:uncharacterized alpha-E superfamily protein